MEEGDGEGGVEHLGPMPEGSIQRSTLRTASCCCVCKHLASRLLFILAGQLFFLQANFCILRANIP